MNETIRLGGNIELVGTEWIDPATMIVLKKITGNYARQYTQKTPVEKLSLSFSKTNVGIILTGMLSTKNTSYSAETTHKNLFIALDHVLKQIEKEI